MINIKQLTKEDIGRWVIYHDGNKPEEKGMIKSWNDTYIFVVYKCSDDWDNFKNYTGCATRPEQLTFLDSHPL